MPLYEFKCNDCGIFDLWRTMAESSSPADCPTCQTAARRIFSPPILLSGSLRLSKTANPEPELVKRDGLRPTGGHREPEPPKLKSPQGRPWMINH
ncbi:MAG: zinc ribbon domain-containing protein [Aphanocapsa sp. GSE-SYN-MK-11-07L]|jgi:putative FmdB family regulatory protein|nr:zinc ribbon domain-containing protein [Aphanocapsa sp. GSE-SYN-MK-11-07L]